MFLFVPLALQAEQTSQPSASGRPLSFMIRPDKAQRKLAKKRSKQISRLVKQYRKASTEQKAAIKAQIEQIVSEATDESMAWMQERIAAEKENLSQWERKLQERQANLEQVKAQRVEEILSGEAKRRFKLAKKRWKKEIRDLKKSMK